ncbi:uncharacterized protein TRIVIDRAFT_135791, partial [Trichoderma virens Gv29-8]
AAVANGHMQLQSPPPFRSKYNPNAGYDIDYSMTSPLDASGSDFPCKGYHKLLGTPAGKSVATWAPGGSYSFTITGTTANHGGGSCQASLSYDKGQTWKVIHSYIGACPPPDTSNWSFTVPSDAPSGEAMFAWTWFNKIGNREMYMNCAAVTIGAGKKRAASTPFSSLPDIFVANVANNVCTFEGKDVQFPNPGSIVDNKSQGTAPPGQSDCTGPAPASPPPVAPPAGDPDANTMKCSASPSSQPPASQPAPTSAPMPTVPGGVFITSPIGQPTQAPTQPTTLVSVTSVSQPPAATSSGPQQTPSPPPPTNGGSKPPSGSTTAGTPCSAEGQWNCASDGKSFQRCASGAWSASIPVAPGTSCQPGTSDNLTLVKKRS